MPQGLFSNQSDLFIIAVIIIWYIKKKTVLLKENLKEYYIVI